MSGNLLFVGLRLAFDYTLLFFCLAGYSGSFRVLLSCVGFIKVMCRVGYFRAH
jgi:hypothetical protein